MHNSSNPNDRKSNNSKPEKPIKMATIEQVKMIEKILPMMFKNVHDIFEPISSDVERTFSTGIEYCARQCEDLLKRGAPGLHFYSLNRVEPVASIWKQVVAPED